MIGLYLMPATGFYPEVNPKDSPTLSRALEYNRRGEFQDHRTDFRHPDDRGWDSDSRAGTITKTLRQRPLAEAARDCFRPIVRWYDVQAEIHWYEAHGVGIHEYKIKHILDE